MARLCNWVAKDRTDRDGSGGLSKDDLEVLKRLLASSLSSARISTFLRHAGTC